MSEVGSPKQTSKKTASDKPEDVLRISTTRAVPFWVKSATNFLQGVTGKDGIEKKIFDQMTISALGTAIPSAVATVGLLEKNDVGSVVKIETHYAQLNSGKRAQVQITVKRNPKYVAPVKVSSMVIPPCPERLTTDKLEKKMKKVIKEGGKRGVEIEGAADMGGLKYFCTKMLEPAGDLDMLVESVKAMNAKSDPSEEERKGGAGHIGKVVMSMADDDNLCIVAYVPEDESKACNAKEWLEYVLKMCGAKGVAIREDSSTNYAMVCVKNDGEKGVFCLKMRDYVIQHANAFLRDKNLLPENVDESEDEMVFGDDDFP
ncbi:unnamed protein product [Amoebophrya sp. A25]|nr:unnamed protein product [Amoebophrya sp. A25]|eukprot:GSA25T00004857001.1